LPVAHGRSHSLFAQLQRMLQTEDNILKEPCGDGGTNIEPGCNMRLQRREVCPVA
jgi:hypothetical protein